MLSRSPLPQNHHVCNCVAEMKPRISPNIFLAPQSAAGSYHCEEAPRCQRGIGRRVLLVSPPTPTANRLADTVVLQSPTCFFQSHRIVEWGANDFAAREDIGAGIATDRGAVGGKTGARIELFAVPCGDFRVKDMLVACGRRRVRVLGRSVRASQRGEHARVRAVGAGVVTCGACLVPPGLGWRSSGTVLAQLWRTRGEQPSRPFQQWSSPTAKAPEAPHCDSARPTARALNVQSQKG